MMKCLSRPLINRSRGMTLVEVVIAIALATMLSAGMYGSAIYTMRQTAKNVEHIFALQLVSSEAAAVRASRFDKLQEGPATLSDDDFEKRFASPRTVVMNPVDPHSPTYTVEYKFTGFGTGVEAAPAGNSGNWFFTLPEHSADWEQNQFKDHMLVITGGSGVNQVMYILENDETKQQGPNRRTKARLTSDLTGQQSGGGYGWKGANPGPNSMFAVDYGMYCEVTVSWDDGAGYKTVSEMVYVPNAR